MTTPMSPICFSCLHLNGDDEERGYSCKAFPDGIPPGIILNRVDHRKPVEGDHGIQFEQDPDRRAIGSEYDAILAKERSE